MKYYKELGKSIFKENINENELRYQENAINSDDLVSKCEFFKKINQIK
ncbi:hypothetical protein [Caloranaerobacter sp. TR13]|nr:hypothetical protein [Caloranaerobacter sp. TR13]